MKITIKEAILLNLFIASLFSFWIAVIIINQK
jgi:hypothetical protein